jgi:NAD(P)-dependent dehydrogenase (short-subunit alcohol dehydrogenase family)
MQAAKTCFINRTSFVTGSSRGIGAAIATQLAAEGAIVVVNYANSAQAAQAVLFSTCSSTIRVSECSAFG